MRSSGVLGKVTGWLNVGLMLVWKLAIDSLPKSDAPLDL